mmetsp:Transcript_44517/g.53863  ORF Transcript_44517/g.53863 Transcript_44517/m.53863 type:complete len:246 (-) Transcript_44517:165-902(-)
MYDRLSSVMVSYCSSYFLTRSRRSVMASTSVIPRKSGLLITLKRKFSSKSSSSSQMVSTKTMPVGLSARFSMEVHSSRIHFRRALVEFVASKMAVLSRATARLGLWGVLLMYSSSSSPTSSSQFNISFSAKSAASCLILIASSLFWSKKFALHAPDFVRSVLSFCCCAKPACASLRYFPTLNTLQVTPRQFKKEDSLREMNDLPLPGRPTRTITSRCELLVNFLRFSSLFVVTFVAMAGSADPFA